MIWDYGAGVFDGTRCILHRIGKFVPTLSMIRLSCEHLQFPLVLLPRLVHLALCDTHHPGVFVGFVELPTCLPACLPIRLVYAKIPRFKFRDDWFVYFDILDGAISFRKSFKALFESFFACNKFR